MVTWERRVRRARPWMPDRMSLIRPRPVPQRVQDDVAKEGERRSGEPAAGSELPLSVPTGTSEEPERRGRQDHEWNACLLDPAEETAEPVVMQRKRIDRVVE